MSPDKLFDYLDGNLPPAECEELERQIAADSQLQRELAIAREIHKRAHGSREVLGVADEELQNPARAAVIGRRVATIFAALVLINVLAGIWFIGREHRNEAGVRQQEAAMRAQLTASLEKTAAIALPAPTLADEIKISAPASERDSVASKIIAIAAEMGGSGTKALPDDNGVTILVELPADREAAFRQALVPLGAPSPPPPDNSSAKTGAPNDKKILQVRISHSASAPAP